MTELCNAANLRYEKKIRRSLLAYDPLSPATRKAGGRLVFLSSGLLVVDRFAITLKSIPSYGFEISQPDMFMNWCLLGAIIGFFVQFLVYVSDDIATSDYKAYNKPKFERIACLVEHWKEAGTEERFHPDSIDENLRRLNDEIYNLNQRGGFSGTPWWRKGLDYFFAPVFATVVVFMHFTGTKLPF